MPEFEWSTGGRSFDVADRRTLRYSVRRTGNQGAVSCMDNDQAMWLDGPALAQSRPPIGRSRSEPAA